MKIIDKINEYKEKKETFFSFEYFPPKTEAGVQNLYDRLDRMLLLNPGWIDVTWGAGGSTSDLTMEICASAQVFCGLETMMHLTCTNMSVDLITEGLTKAKEAGITNILALRGDPPRGEEWKQFEGGFANAVDLVKHIRKEYGDFFGIGVAGYPEGHLDCVNYEEDLQRLKEKIDAGGDFIVTQLFYDVDLFLKFVQDCKNIGITCPIIPGIMPILTYGGFSRMTELCKTIIPKEITDALEPIKDDEEAVKKFGIEYGIKMCKKLLDAGIAGLHFYTLNLEKSVQAILEGLGLLDPNREQKPLPWNPATADTRPNEGVRPIFWRNRPKSYIARTMSWDEFPNGRWGDSNSPAFGDLGDYHLSSLYSNKNTEKSLSLWGEPKTEKDVQDVFVNFVTGKIDSLPWSQNKIAPETNMIASPIEKLNRLGFLTINSQPKVNGAPSSDEVVGWGGAGGYVYQKAYVEFFCSKELLDDLIASTKKFPSITFSAVNVKGDKITDENVPAESERVTALTWGVFPNKEILQPTVADPNTFEIWKEEAFSLWVTEWGKLYGEDSASRKLIQQIHDTYYLVFMIDNDYVGGDMFNVFNDVMFSKLQK